MTRVSFMEEIEAYIDSSKMETVDPCYIKAKYKCDGAKNGIYFLYDDNDQIIYVGKISNAEKTSFYHRMYGHGTGAHKNEHWFKECKKFRFKKFPLATETDLRVIERLMIFQKGQPKYNDIGRIIYSLDEIFARVKEGEVNG